MKLTREAKAEYKRRKRNLLVLGYISYSAYLRSFLWSEIRKDVLRRNGKCRVCGKKATQVHHADYELETLRGDGIAAESLWPVCKRCHKGAEFKAGRKLGPTEATRRMKKRIRKTMQRYYKARVIRWFRAWEKDQRMKELIDDPRT